MTVRRVTVAIPSWNGREHLEICLPALAEQRDPGVDWEVCVLDNGSRDGTREWLARAHPEVRILASDRNLGFAAGVNRLVAASEADAVALLNNDTRPTSDWLVALVDALRTAPEDVAAVSGTIVDWTGERLDFGRGVVTFDGHAFQLDYRRPLASARRPAAGDELPFACGGNMIVRRDAFARVGGFDESFFAYYEDVDLGWRLWSGGWRVLAAPEAVVHHRSMASSDLLGLYHRGMLFERNAFLTAYKNLDEPTWASLSAAILLTLMARTETLLAEANPGGAQLRIDPYAGHIADTASRGTPSQVGPSPPRRPSLARRLHALGPRESLRRARQRLGRWLAGEGALALHPILADPRTVAQVRAVSWIVRHLDLAAERRRAVQRARRRPDREILERFPLYLVPTYPGDEALFASPGFRALLPDEVPRVEATLPEVMAWGE